jgi:ribonuclease BN (tRNA processing enzyme)
VTAAGPASPAQLELTVLGSSSSIPRPGRACSAYLVQGAGRSIVFDLGSGAFANLRRALPAEEVDAVIISHMHPDHFLDLVPMRYALRYGARTHARRPLLYLPPDGEALLRRVVDAFPVEVSHDYLEVYDIRTYDPRRELLIGDLRLRFALTAHFIPTFAVRCESGSASLTYSADTAPEARVSELARETDAFICEATLGPAQREPGLRGHSSAREAGTMAADAGAARLVLSHYGAESTPAQLVREGSATFEGTLVVADDNTRLSL